jgi:hypothetical protein
MSEWYGMGFIVPFTLLMAEGAAALLAWADSLFRRTSRLSIPALSAACVLLIALWLSAKPASSGSLLMPRGGTHFLFARPPITRAAEVSRFFTPMPHGVGIMAPVDLVPEIVYLTDKRVVALPFDPDLLDRFIADYRISYLLVSSEFMTRYESPLRDQYTSSLVTHYIFANPQRYVLVHMIHENYPAFFPPLDYYVFKVFKVGGYSDSVTRDRDDPGNVSAMLQHRSEAAVPRAFAGPSRRETEAWAII